MDTPAGTISQLARYPVKSMAGELLPLLEIDWQGVEGDRQYGFCKTGDRGRFPWLTGRDVPDIVRFAATYRNAGEPRVAPVEVQMPDGRRLDLSDPQVHAILEEAAGAGIRLMQLGRGAYDAMPISIVSTATLAALDRAHGAPLDRRRFRINLIVESDASELDWCGKRLRFGDLPDGAELLVTAPIPRCVMVTIDPDTGERDPSVMKTVVQQFDNQVGVYATAATPGLIRMGDVVRLLA